MRFWVSLARLVWAHDEIVYFLNKNATHVTGNYWLYEGENDCLFDCEGKIVIEAEGDVGFLGGLTEEELIRVVDDDLGVKLKKGQI